jgi:hypothetical protein
MLVKFKGGKMKKMIVLVLLGVLFTTTLLAGEISVFGFYNASNMMSGKSDLSIEAFLAGTDVSLGELDGKIKYDMEATGGLGLGVEYTENLNENMNWVAGASYEMSREFKDKKVKFDFVGDFEMKGELALLSLFANLNYLINENVYLLGGISYALSTGNNDITGGLGYQIGAGYMINEQLSIEGIYKIQNLTLAISDKADFVDPVFGNLDLKYDLDATEVSLAGLQVFMKYRL